MPYSEALAERVRFALTDVHSVEEKKMFGGLAFLVNEKMCINAGENRLMFRIDPAIHQDVLKREGCRTVTMKGRDYQGYVYVSEEGLRTKEDFDYWIGLALDYNKKAKASPRRRNR